MQIRAVARRISLSVKAVPKYRSLSESRLTKGFNYEKFTIDLTAMRHLSRLTLIKLVKVILQGKDEVSTAFVLLVLSPLHFYYDLMGFLKNDAF